MRLFLLLLSLNWFPFAVQAGQGKWVLPADSIPVFSDDSLEVLPLHPSIGYTIDRKERDKYKFFSHHYFPLIYFESAQFLRDRKGEIILRAKMLTGKIYERRSSLREIRYNFRKVEYFDERRRTGTIAIMLTLLAAAWAI